MRTLLATRYVNGEKQQCEFPAIDTPTAQARASGLAYAWIAGGGELYLVPTTGENAQRRLDSISEFIVRIS